MKLVLQILIILLRKTDDWIQVLDHGADQDNSPTVFSPVNPGPVNCILKDFLPHQYFLHMFGGFCRLISEGNQYLWRQNLFFVNGIIQTQKSCLQF